jgi:DMSO/TMAO reductase YedYZ molybdopterin-dependent catalytic subunit
MSKTPEQELKERTRRSLIGLGAGAVVVVAGAYWIKDQPDADEIPQALRGVLNFNEKVVRAALFSDRHLTKTYPASAIGKLKKNGDFGMEDKIDEAAWRLSVGDKTLTLADVQTLPKVEETIDFKCVEGWSTVTSFAGARLSDFTAKFAPGGSSAEYVGMQTPDKNYYVSVDMPSAMHPQTLLAWEMNGQPLTQDHGAPLRLVMPVKYGIKNIKRIAKIEYTNTRPPDYWEEQGYDWYSGL